MNEGFAQGFEFDHLARRPMYSRCPLWLLEHCPISDDSKVADLGCGSGLLTEFIVKQFPESPALRVYAIDPSEWELKIAKERVSDERVVFVKGTAQEATRQVPDCDVVFLCNVLHQIPLDERPSVVQGAFDLLRPGGHFGCNTLFYDGGVPPETNLFNIVWMNHARSILEAEGVDWKPDSKGPISPAFERLSPAEHRSMLKQAGFESVVVEEVQFDWSAEDWEALSKYSVFVRGVFPRADLAVGSRALIDGAKRAYRELGLTSIRRGWLQCAGRKGTGAT